MKRFIKLFLLAIVSVLAVSFLSPALAPLCSSISLGSEIDQHCQSVTSALPTFQSLWKTASSNEQVWAGSGAVVFPLAANVTSNRNEEGQTLTSFQKQQLRPVFGALVDRVKINYNAKLMDRWTNGDQEIHFGDVDSSAQTYCDRIYLRGARQEKDSSQLTLIAHEMGHFQQCDRLGSEAGFGSAYFRAYYIAGQKYANNRLEKEARAIEKKFVQQLCQINNCNLPQGRYYEDYKKTGLNVPVTLSAPGAP
jgi:Domain of unknown function (DUF4157)